MAYNKNTNLYEGYIYLILNTVYPDKIYVGQTSVTPNNRWKGHMLQAKESKHNNTDKLHNYMARYGIENFGLTVIEMITCKTKDELIDRLNEKEIYYIDRFDTYKNGLNSTRGGRNAMDHKKRPVIQYDLDGNIIKEHESIDSLKEMFDSVSTIYDCCLHNNARYAYGYLWKYKDDLTPLPKLTDSEKREAINRYKMRCPIYEYYYNGILLNIYNNIDDLLKINPNITREQVLLCCSGRNYGTDLKIYRFEGDSFDKYKTFRDKPKIVEQYDINGNLIHVYASARLADYAYGGKGSVISNACRNNKIAYGFIWKYASNTLKEVKNEKQIINN